MDKKHIAFMGYNEGICTFLKGDIAIAAFMMDDGRRLWKPGDILKTEKIFRDSADYLEKEAGKRGIDLHIDTKFISVKVTSLQSAASADDKREWKDSAMNFVGAESINEFVSKKKDEWKASQVAVIFLFPFEGRPYSMAASVGTLKEEYAVLYRADIHSVCHELLHLFGAMDFYFPESVKNAAMCLGSSIMREADSMVIDPLTEYIIGWRAGITREGEEFLKATCRISQEQIFKARRDEMKNGYGSTSYADGTYTGSLKNGIPFGSGVFRHKKGDVYDGEWRDGKYDGFGIYRSQKGFVYKGGMKNGRFHGRGELLYSNGCRYIGEFQIGVKSGAGRMEYEGGTVYEGQMTDDKCGPTGKCMYANGTVYIGGWKDSRPQGSGVMEYENGVRDDGEWESGVFVSGIRTYPGGREEIIEKELSAGRRKKVQRA